LAQQVTQGALHGSRRCPCWGAGPGRGCPLRGRDPVRRGRRLPVPLFLERLRLACPGRGGLPPGGKAKGSPHVYNPQVLDVPAGRPVALDFTDYVGGCALVMGFPGLGPHGTTVSVLVPVGQTRRVTVEVPRPGRYRYHCPEKNALRRTRGAIGERIEHARSQRRTRRDREDAIRVVPPQCSRKKRWMATSSNTLFSAMTAGVVRECTVSNCAESGGESAASAQPRPVLPGGGRTDPRGTGPDRQLVL
jgi:hypothetical protein